LMLSSRGILLYLFWFSVLAFAGCCFEGFWSPPCYKC
jgi:hypothetical protein